LTHAAEEYAKAQFKNARAYGYFRKPTAVWTNIMSRNVPLFRLVLPLICTVAENDFLQNEKTIASV